MVCGEASGDLLGAGLIHALREKFPHAHFEGIAGPAMLSAGCHTLYDAERLAVMGFVEPLKRLPELLTIRSGIVSHFLTTPPDIFIGIDAPDFNLAVEAKLKAQGIPTVHYVSPSVWAWRQYRVKKIARAVDLMLTLFPFEAAFFEAHHVPVKFVGHPLADMLPLEPDTAAARRELNLPTDKKIVALLPGSRMGEVTLLAEPFLDCAAWCYAQHPDLHFVMPLATAKTGAFVEALRARRYPQLPVTLFEGQSRRVMAAADVVLLASGTATLEAMLLKKPMVVGYKVSTLTYWLAKALVNIPYFSLPNLLAGERLVAEFIQDELQVEPMGRALLGLLVDTTQQHALHEQFTLIHHRLRQSASHTAAQAISGLLKGAH